MIKHKLSEFNKFNGTHSIDIKQKLIVTNDLGINYCWFLTIFS